jgi:hypothetical protein
LFEFGPQALDSVLASVAGHRMLPDRVQQEIDQIAAGFDQRITGVEVRGGAAEYVGTINWSEPVRRPEPERRHVPRTLHGRLLEVDWKDHTAELHSPSGVTKVAFPDDMESDLQRWAREHVSLIGEASVSEDEPMPAAFIVRAIVGTIDDRQFWNPVSIDQLVERQGVGVFTFPSLRDDPDAVAESEELIAAIFES